MNAILSLLLLTASNWGIVYAMSDKAPAKVPHSFDLVPSGKLEFPRSRPVLFVFYPGDFTPTCTKQMCDYRDNYQHFQKLNADIIGVSADSGQSHEEFVKKYGIPFPLLSDPNKELHAVAGMKATFGLVPKRGYAIADKQGNIVWRSTDTLPINYTNTMDLVKLVKPEIDKLQ